MAEKNHSSDTSESEIETLEHTTQPDDDTASPEITLAHAPELQVEEEAVAEEADTRPEEKPSAFAVEPDILEAVPVHPDAEEQARAQAPRWASRTRAFWTALGISALASVVTLLLSLGILANLNGGSLQFVTTSKLNSLTRQVDGLNTQIDTLDRDVKGLRTRLDNLEALSQSVSAMENVLEQTQDDLAAVNTRMETLQKEIDDFHSQIEVFQEKSDGLQMQMADLQVQNQRFTGFLSGLRDLLDDLLRPEESK